MLREYLQFIIITARAGYNQPEFRWWRELASAPSRWSRRSLRRRSGQALRSAWKTAALRVTPQC